MELAGTPWKPFTLDVSQDAEYCVVNLEALDCFTFIENSVALARLIKLGKSAPEDLIDQVIGTGKWGFYDPAPLHQRLDV